MQEQSRFKFPNGFIANEATVRLIPQEEVCETLLQSLGQMRMEIAERQAESEKMTNFTVAGGLLGAALGVATGVVLALAEPENANTWYLATSVTGAEVGAALR